MLRLVEDGRVAARPLLDLRAKVNTWFFRGMTNVAVDPDFPSRPYVYVSYAVRESTGRAARAPTSVRVSRFRVRGDRADPESEAILVGKANQRPCNELPRGADCLRAVGDHIGTDIVFAPDGTLFVSTGDGSGIYADQAKGIELPSLLALDPDFLSGKVLHIDRQGRGLPGNPFWSGDPDANRSKVWAVGLRNPLRMTPVPGRERVLLVADVGWRRWEELNVVGRASDLGWPCLDGAGRSPVYEASRLCVSYYREGEPTMPWLAIPHPQASTIIGGVALRTARGWPKTYRDDYVFGDWSTSQIFVVPLDISLPAARPTLLAKQAGGPVAFGIGPDGDLYVLSVNIGVLRRIEPE